MTFSATNMTDGVAGNLTGSAILTADFATNIPFLTSLHAHGIWNTTFDTAGTHMNPPVWTFPTDLRQSLLGDFVTAKNGIQLPDPIKNILFAKLDMLGNTSLADQLEVTESLAGSFRRSRTFRTSSTKPASAGCWWTPTSTPPRTAASRP